MGMPIDNLNSSISSQVSTPYDPTTAPPTAAELQAVGYAAPSAAQTQAPYDPTTAPPTASELAAVGYTPQTGKRPGLIDTATQGLNDLTTASVGEIGSLGAGVIANVGKILGNPQMQAFSADQNRLDNTVAAARTQSPIMGAIGKWGTDVVGALGTSGSSMLGLAAGGAAAGLATSKGEDNPLVNVAIGAGIGGSLGAAGKAITDVISPTLSGAILRAQSITDPSTFADNVVSSVIDKLGGKAGNMTPNDLIAGIRSTLNDVTTTKDGLYALRDTAASQANDGAGITVSREAFSTGLNDLKSLASQSSSSQLDSTIAEAERVLQTGADVPFNIAQNGVNSLKSAAYEASRTGNLQKSKLLLGLASNLEDDITKAIPEGSDLSALHQNATDYARNIYYPLKDSNIENVVASRASEVKYLANVTQSALNTNGPTVNSALNQLDPGWQANIVAANINAIKAAATPDGAHLNLVAFSKALNTEMSKYGAAYGEAMAPIRTLANVLNATAIASKGEANSLGSAAATSLLSGLGFSLGGPAGATLGALAPKTAFLYGAGKMLQNPATLDLLNSADMVSAYPKSAMARAIGNKITKAFSNQLASIPARIAPAFGIGLANNSDVSL